MTDRIPPHHPHLPICKCRLSLEEKKGLHEREEEDKTMTFTGGTSLSSTSLGASLPTAADIIEHAGGLLSHEEEVLIPDPIPIFLHDSNRAATGTHTIMFNPGGDDNVRTSSAADEINQPPVLENLPSRTDDTLRMIDESLVCDDISTGNISTSGHNDFMACQSLSSLSSALADSSLQPLPIHVATNTANMEDICETFAAGNHLHDPFFLEKASTAMARACSSTKSTTTTAATTGLNSLNQQELSRPRQQQLQQSIQHDTIKECQGKINPTGAAATMDAAAAAADSTPAPTTRMNNDNLNGGLYRPVLWDIRYKELILYKQRYGNCLVPNEWPQNRQLASWVKRQRYQYKLKVEDGKRSTLTPERYQKLVNIGFVWKSQKCKWETKFRELTKFVQQHGHCDVPTKYPANPALGTWVKSQRSLYRSYLLYNNQAAEEVVPTSTTNDVTAPKTTTMTAWSASATAASYAQAGSSSISPTPTANIEATLKPPTLTKERVQRLQSLGFSFAPKYRRKCLCRTISTVRVS